MPIIIAKSTSLLGFFRSFDTGNLRLRLLCSRHYLAGTQMEKTYDTHEQKRCQQKEYDNILDSGKKINSFIVYIGQNPQYDHTDHRCRNLGKKNLIQHRSAHGDFYGTG